MGGGRAEAEAMSTTQQGSVDVAALFREWEAREKQLKQAYYSWAFSERELESRLRELQRIYLPPIMAALT